MKELHALVDYENVQPSLEALAKLAPGFTDVWLFHGPHQVKQAQAWLAQYFLQEDKAVQSAVSTLQQMQAVPLNVELPNLNDSQAALRSLSQGKEKR